MAHRDDYRGYRGEDRKDRSGRDDWGFGGGRRGGEHRSFGERGGRGEGEMEPWRRERYGSRYDQDRVNYGSGYDRERGGYGRGVQDEDRSRFGGNRGYESGARGYGGQEYGVEGQGWRDQTHGEGRMFGGGQRQGSPDRTFREQPRETWRERGGQPYGDLELNARNQGIQEFGAPHDYAYHPAQGHELDPDYTRWRDEQLASHDRDYQEWRRHQQEQYDNEYRQFRNQRREHFGATFQQWRAQRNVSGGVQDTNIAPGMGPDAQKTAFGGTTGSDAGRASGAVESGNHGLTSSSPVLTQVGGGGQRPTDQGSSTGDTTPEFGRGPAQVQAASSGWDTRRKADDAAEPRDDGGKHAADDLKKDGGDKR